MSRGTALVTMMTIKEARVQVGMSRAEMSRVFEIPIRTLEDWDAGKSCAKVDYRETPDIEEIRKRGSLPKRVTSLLLNFSYSNTI